MDIVIMADFTAAVYSAADVLQWDLHHAGHLADRLADLWDEDPEVQWGLVPEEEDLAGLDVFNLSSKKDL